MGLQWALAATEPKSLFRWVLQFPGIDNIIPTWIVKTAQKPKFSITESSHKYLNHTFYFPGRVEWEEVSVTLVDPVSPDASAGLISLLDTMGYATPDLQNESAPLKTISKASSAAVLGQVTLTQFDQAGSERDKWYLRNAWIKSIDSGGLDYESDDLVNIDMTLRYDWAELA